MEEIHKEATEDGDVNFEEDILAVICPMGRFQVRVTVWGMLQDVVNAMCVMFFLFGGVNPGFICIDRHDDLNSTSQHQVFYNSVCTENVACSKRLYNTDDFNSIISEWDLVCDRSIYSTYISSAMMFGSFLGAPLFSWLADMFGRKKVVFPLVAILILNQMLTSTAVSWIMMLFFRFITGFVVGGSIVLNFNIPLEMMNAKWRAFCLTLTGWAFGTTILVLLAFFIREWRHLAIASGACSLPLLLFWFVVPESPRWLIQKERFKEAKSVLRLMAQVNRRPEPDYSLLPKIAEQDRTTSSREKYTFLDLFQTRTMRINICVVALFYLTAAACYYGSSMNVKQLSGNRYENALIMAALEQLSYISLMFATHWLGRKQCVAGYMLGGGVCLILMIIAGFLKQNETTSTLQTALGLLGRASIGGAWVVASVLPAELFPTLIRNTAGGFCSMSSRIGGVAAPFIAHLYDIHPSAPFAVFGIMAVLVSVALAFTIPETRNQPMPDKMPHSAIRLKCCCRVGRKDDVSHNEAEEVELRKNIEA